MKKTIKITALVFITAIILFIASLFVFSKFYGDKISQIVITELNKRLNVKVAVGSIDFSVFKHFPYASVSLNDVVVYSSETFNKKEFSDNPDIFLQAKHLSLQFNIMDLLRKKYNISKIYLTDSKLSVFLDKHGKNNFQILKADTSKTPSKVSIDLKKVQADNCDYRYIDNQSTFKCNGFIQSIFLKGRFASNDFELETKLKGISKQIVVDNNHFPSNISIDLESSVHVLDSTYTINSCDLVLNDIETKVAGRIQKKKVYHIDLNTQVNYIQLSELEKYFPETLRQKLKPWNPEGELKLDISSIGPISDVELPSLKMIFELENGSFSYKNHQSKLDCKGIFLSKNLFNRSSYSLSIDTVDLKYNKSEYVGRIALTDFTNPHLTTNGRIQLNLLDVYDFTDNKETVSKGLLTGTINLQTNLNDIDSVDEHLFEKLHLISNLELSDGYFLYKPNRYSEVNNLKASIKTNDDTYLLDTCSFDYFDSKIMLKGKLSNVLKFALGNNQILNGELSIKTNCIDYNKIMKDASSDSSSVILPLLYNVKVTFETECLKYQKVNVQSLKGQLLYNADGIALENLSMFAFDGRIAGNVYLAQMKNKGFELKSKLTTSNIHVDKVFTALNNFNQKTLVDKNLKGLINSEITFTTELNKDFSVRTKSLLLECSATILNGRLMNFEPMKKLSKFVDVNELDDVSFSTLKNNFTIKDERISIPQMDIKSSALSLQMSGTHSFSGNFEYNIQLYLNELLANKHRNKHPDEYFGEIVDEQAKQTRLPIKIIGTPTDMKISYDTKTAKENVKEGLKKERSELSRIFKEEFGSKKKDSTSVKKTIIKKEEDKQKFEIEFE